ncbi:MAG: hypothetical protein IKC87_08230 [Clostridia bacterium]|nr:hypothetical protein [Clostridia bacterium]
MKKTLLSFILLVSCVLSLSSCNIFHDHVWINYLEKTPTCSSIGVIKRICYECGEVEYDQIATLFHNYDVIGKCTECGAYASEKELKPIKYPIDLDYSGIKSLSDIHEFACTLGSQLSYSEFIKAISYDNFALYDIHISSVNRLTSTVKLKGLENTTIEIPISVMIDEIKIVNPYNSIGDVLRFDIISGELLITYKTGEQISAGFINQTARSVTGFGISVQNEILIFYSDDTVAFAGKI